MCTAKVMLIKTKVYSKYFDKGFKLVSPGIFHKFTKKIVLIKLLNLLKMGKVRDAERVLKPAVNYLIKIKCKLEW